MSSKQTDAHNIISKGGIKLFRPRLDGRSTVDRWRPSILAHARGLERIGGSEEKNPSIDGCFDSKTPEKTRDVQGLESRAPVIKIFFDHLPKKASLNEIENKLAAFGAVRYLRVPFSPQKNKNMGYGQVVFEDQELARRLIQQRATFTINDHVVSLTSFVDRSTKRKEYTEVNLFKYDQISHSRRAKNLINQELPPNIKRDVSFLFEDERFMEPALADQTTARHPRSTQSEAGCY